MTLHDYETTEESCYLVTELINGKTLAQFIQEHPQGCDPRIAVEIIVHIADALAHAHSKNVIHRDIKPSNILLDFSLPIGSFSLEVGCKEGSLPTGSGCFETRKMIFGNFNGLFVLQTTK